MTEKTYQTETNKQQDLGAISFSAYPAPKALIKNKQTPLQQEKLTISTGKEILRLPKHTTKHNANNNNTDLIPNNNTY